MKNVKTHKSVETHTRSKNVYDCINIVNYHLHGTRWGEHEGLSISIKTLRNPNK